MQICQHNVVASPIPYNFTFVGVVCLLALAFLAHIDPQFVACGGADALTYVGIWAAASDAKCFRAISVQIKRRQLAVLPHTTAAITTFQIALSSLRQQAHSPTIQQHATTHIHIYMYWHSVENKIVVVCLCMCACVSVASDSQYICLFASNLMIQNRLCM